MRARAVSGRKSQLGVGKVYNTGWWIGDAFCG